MTEHLCGHGSHQNGKPIIVFIRNFLVSSVLLEYAQQTKTHYQKFPSLKHTLIFNLETFVIY